jgi:hypothetical protein
MVNKKNYYYSIIFLATVSASAITICLLKKAKRKKISRVVAEAGYETAHDIHFPLKINKLRKF